MTTNGLKNNSKRRKNCWHKSRKNGLDNTSSTRQMIKLSSELTMTFTLTQLEDKEIHQVVKIIKQTKDSGPVEEETLNLMTQEPK